MKPSDRVYVAGHTGLVGSALVRRLERDGYSDLVLRTHAELDLTDRAAVLRFFGEQRPAFVFVAAARVGGILANDTWPVEFLRDNLAIGMNVIDAAHTHGASKLLFLGSSCAFPKHAPQPMREEYLLSGPLEPTNQWYAVAKIAGIKLCQAYRRQHGADFIAVNPTNLYGPGDNYDPRTSHVLPALIRRFHAAVRSGDDQVTLWGTGTVRREFMHVDDLADACVFLMREYSEETPLNVGWGSDVSIAELAALVAETSGFRGRIAFDPSMPDGTPRKLLDTTRLTALGWTPRIHLAEGVGQACRDYARAASERPEPLGAHA